MTELEKVLNEKRELRNRQQRIRELEASLAWLKLNGYTYEEIKTELKTLYCGYKGVF